MAGGGAKQDEEVTRTPLIGSSASERARATRDEEALIAFCLRCLPTLSPYRSLPSLPSLSPVVVSLRSLLSPFVVSLRSLCVHLCRACVSGFATAAAEGGSALHDADAEMLGWMCDHLPAPAAAAGEPSFRACVVMVACSRVRLLVSRGRHQSMWHARWTCCRLGCWCRCVRTLAKRLPA